MIATKALLSKNEAQEQAAFKYFLEMRNFQGDSESFESIAPPAPDILYKDSLGYIAFELLEICAPNIAGAKFYDGVSSYIRPHDTYKTKLKDKLKKSYITNYPVELLCYTAGRVVTPDDLIIEHLKPVIDVQDIQFSKIWLLGDNLHLLYDKQ
ncbi:MAG: hypothetical protein K9G62_03845 [Alphaproteobacteria bacterium]|nr:hypothetical protein [Alphaproteobacteria bacterium]